MSQMSPKPSQGWVKISGTSKSPATAVSMRLRLGFSYAKGICWWDDVTVTPKYPLSTRLDLAEPRISPAMTGNSGDDFESHGGKAKRSGERVIEQIDRRTAGLAFRRDRRNSSQFQSKRPNPGR